MNNLIKKYYELNIRSDNEIIEYIQKNKFDNIDYYQLDLNSKHKYINILINYCFALINSSNSAIVLKVCEQLMTYIKHDKNELDKYTNFYEDIRLCKGIVLSKLKKYRQSNEIFNELKSENSDNDKYSIWYNANRIFKVEQISKPLLVCGTGICFLTIFLEKLNLYDFGKTPIYVVAIMAIIHLFQLIWSEYFENAKLFKF